MIKSVLLKKKKKEGYRLMIKSRGRTSGMDQVKQAQDFHSGDDCSGPVWTTSTSSPPAGDTRPIQSFRYEDASSVSQTILDGATLRLTISIQVQKIHFHLWIVTVELCWGLISPRRSSHSHKATRGGSYGTFHHYSVSDKIWRLKQLNKWREIN